MPWNQTPKTPFDSSLWHPLNIPLPRAPSERELQHGFGPAGCAVLIQAHFDRRFDRCPSGDLGFEEGCAADLASLMPEPPLGGGRVPQLQSALRQSGRDEEAELCEAAARQGSGEQHVQRMPEPGRRNLRTSGLSSAADTCRSRTTTALLGEFHNAKRFVSQNVLETISP